MHDREQLASRVQDEVTRLIRYAVKDPSVHTDREFLERIVPLLFKAEGELTQADYVELWEAHNQLSNKLAPVTAESLEVYEEINKGRKGDKPKNPLGWCGLLGYLWLLIGIMALFIPVQWYSLLLSNSITEFAAIDSALTKALDEERVALQTASREAPDNQGIYDREPLRSIEDRKRTLQNQMFFHAKKQCGLLLSLPVQEELCQSIDKWPKSDNPKFLMTAESSEVKKLPAFDPAFYSIAHAVAKSAKSTDLVLSNLVLPLLLGFLGAGAFLTRSTLQYLNDFTYVQSWNGRYVMRLLLGGLLGVMGPWLYSSGKMDQVGLGLSLFAFLLGYSVELAFSIFDRLISFAREAIKLEPKPTTAPTSIIKPSAAAPEKAQAETAEASRAATPRDLPSLRARLKEIQSVGPILEESLPPEFYENIIRPRVESAGKLLAQLEKESDEAKVASSVLAEAKKLAGEDHPVALVLRSALGSFTEALGPCDPPDKPARLLLALFYGAVSAFARGAGVYERWMAYILSRPYVVRQAVGVQPSPEEDRKRLAGTTIFIRAFGDAPEPLAVQIAALAQTEKMSQQLAAEIWENPSILQGFTGDLHELFSGVEEFEEGWAEYRHVLLRETLKRDFPEDVFPGLDASSMRVSEVLAMTDILRENRPAAGDLDTLAHLAQGLMKASQESANIDVVGLVRGLLPLPLVSPPAALAAGDRAG